jgi:hypothetical protein
VQQQDWFIIGDPGSDGLLIHSVFWKLFSFAHRDAKQVLGQAPKLHLGRPQVEKIIGTGDIADSSVANVREAEDPRQGDKLIVEGQGSLWQKEPAQPTACFPPGGKAHPSHVLGGRVQATKSGQSTEHYFIGATTKPIAVQNPAVLGKSGEELFAKCYDMNAVKMAAQGFQQWLRISGMANFGGYDKSHRTPSTQQTGSDNKKRSPRR